jgi:predicted RND superfamily exporter protein
VTKKRTTNSRRSVFDAVLTPVYRWTLAHPILVLLILAAITVVMTGFISRLEIDVDFSNYLNRNDPAVVAADEAQDRYGSQLRSMVIVEAPHGLFQPETLARIDAMENELEALAVVAEVTGPFNSKVIRGTEAAVSISSVGPGGSAPTTPEEIETYREAVLNDRTLLDYVISSSETAAAIYVRPIDDVEMVPFAEMIEAVVSRYESEELRMSIAGIPYMNLTLGRSMRRDLGLFLPLIILAIVVVLYAAFRWRWGVLIPFAVVGLSVLWTLGLMAVCSVPITVLSFILPVVLMAIGIADGIHVLGRYREEARGTEDKAVAILRTMTTMQRPVVMTSLTTAAGFLSLLNAYMIPQRMFGLFTSAGILFAMILSLVLIPAVLRLVKVPAVSAKGARARSPVSSGLGAVVRGVIRARWLVLVGTVAVAVVFAGGISTIHIETSQRAYLGEDHPAVESLDQMDELFSGGDQVMIEIDTGVPNGLKDPAVLERMVALEGFLAERGVRKTMSLAGIVSEMNQRFNADDPAFYVIPDDPRMVAQLLLLFTFQGGTLGSLALGDFSAGEIIGFHALETGEERVELVRDVTDYLDEHFENARLVGSTRIQSSMFASIARSQLTSLFTSIGAAGIIVILLMGSVLAGLISLVPLLFTIVVSFGVMAYAGMSLDIATLMISSITIGIGIDYGIHYIERAREEMKRTKDRSLALVHAAQTAGRGIVYNALALAGGFSILLLSAFRGMRHFGLLITMTMLISAAGALVVIPAILRAFPVMFRGRSGEG